MSRQLNPAPLKRRLKIPQRRLRPSVRIKLYAKLPQLMPRGAREHLARRRMPRVSHGSRHLSARGPRRSGERR